MTRPAAAARTAAPFLPAMSMPLLDSVKGASTLPFAGHVQSTSSASVPFAGGDGGAAVAGAPADGVVAGASPPGAASPADNCASALSEKGSFCARGSTLDVAVFASGRPSIGGPAETSGVAIGPV